MLSSNSGQLGESPKSKGFGVRVTGVQLLLLPRTVCMAWALFLSISELSCLIRELGIKHICHLVATVMQAPVCISGEALITPATIYLLTCLSSPFYGKTPQGNHWLHLHMMVYTQLVSTAFFHFLKVTPSSYSQAYL